MEHSEATPKPVSGKLYTSYFGNISNIPKDMRVFSVVRQPRDLPNIECFSPSAKLLNRYKSKIINYPVFKERFIKELQESELASQMFDSILNLIHSGTDVVFICYENKPEYCHRQILGEIFKTVGIDYVGEI